MRDKQKDSQTDDIQSGEIKTDLECLKTLIYKH